MLSALARWFAGLEGARRLLVAALLGALATAAMPPWHMLPLLLPALVGLVWMLQGAARPFHGLLIGWAWGFGHFAAGCYWVTEAYFVPPADFAALGPPMVLGLALLLGAFVAVSCFVLCVIAQRWPVIQSQWRFALLFSTFFSIGEWLRTWVLTGFPWNPLGHVWAFSDVFLQSASLWGVDGLGLLTVTVFSLPAMLALQEEGRRVAIVGFALPLLMVLALWLFGQVRLPAVADETSTFVRLVQPDIPQGEKWLPEMQARHLAKLMSLSISPRPAARAEVTHIIWPETAVPFLLDEAPDVQARISTVVGAGAYLITGAPRSSLDPAMRGRDGRRPVWNSLLVIDSAGKIRATYDKAHLVPFGEYLPLHDVLPILTDTIGRGSFAAGPGPATIELPGLPPVAPIICYEAIFSGAVVPADRRPAWMLNLTNDSWFGHSAGPHQHLVSARLRSVEEGIPMVRVANTGISAVIDAHGRILASIALDLPGTIDHAIPASLPPTFFARFGRAAWAVLLAIVAVCALFMPRVGHGADKA